MESKKKRKALKPSSYILLSELNKAARDLSDTGAVAAAEEKINALALADPEEATRIFLACPAYFDESIEEDELYLGHGIFIERSEARALDTQEKRVAYVNQILAEDLE